MGCAHFEEKTDTFYDFYEINIYFGYLEFSEGGEVSEGIDQFKEEICFFFQNAEPLWGRY